MPTPLHAKDFPHWNGDRQFDAQMDRIFDYYRDHDPEFDTKLQAAHDQGVYLMDNNPHNPLLDPANIGGNIDNRGADLALSVTDANGVAHPTIAINMSSAMLVTKGGQIEGIESVASAVFHELISHLLNPDNDFQLRLDDPGYDHFNERVAVGTDTLENALIGEPNRDNHRGEDVQVSDVTLHTIKLANGDLQLVRMGADGQDEYGPVISVTGTGWKNLQHAFDQVDKADAAWHANATSIIEGIEFTISGNRNADGTSTDFYSDPEPTNGGYHPDFGAFDFKQALHDGEGWTEWQGQTDGGGGKNPDDTLQDKSSDDPDYQHASHMMAPAGKLTYAPTDLNGGTDWLLHFGAGQREHDGYMGQPQPEPAPIPGVEVPLVGVPHVDPGVLM